MTTAAGHSMTRLAVRQAAWHLSGTVHAGHVMTPGDASALRLALDAAAAWCATPPDPASPGPLLAELRAACNDRGWSFSAGCSLGDAGYWDADVSVMHQGEDASGPRTGELVEVEGYPSPGLAIAAALRYAIGRVRDARG